MRSKFLSILVETWFSVLNFVLSLMNVFDTRAKKITLASHFKINVEKSGFRGNKKGLRTGFNC